MDSVSKENYPTKVVTGERLGVTRWQGENDGLVGPGKLWKMGTPGRAFSSSHHQGISLASFPFLFSYK